jgi:hypothetical protein
MFRLQSRQYRESAIEIGTAATVLSLDDDFLLIDEASEGRCGAEVKR